ncbi:hypothetical protein Baya_0111 [Bagarius yarrelli]|uniref:Uncharacterized protein n=1 Tax=Bagarius yarrelli TaxID=175774 RepID=A0A556THB1_BAGYA|nr:hypothetical protein Baya_0111 [Bagarius yarrelli]
MKTKQLDYSVFSSFPSVSSSEWNSSFWHAVVEGTRGDGQLLLPSSPRAAVSVILSMPAQWNHILVDESQQTLLFSRLGFLNRIANYTASDAGPPETPSKKHLEKCCCRIPQACSPGRPEGMRPRARALHHPRSLSSCPVKSSILSHSRSLWIKKKVRMDSGLGLTTGHPQVCHTRLQLECTLGEKGNFISSLDLLLSAGVRMTKGPFAYCGLKCDEPIVLTGKAGCVLKIHGFRPVARVFELQINRRSCPPLYQGHSD